jgi:DNA polymerase-3 subunit beta
MKAECQSEKIKDAIVRAERITGKNLALPVLGSILCIASGKTLRFRATNLNLGVEIEVPAKIEKEGVVAVKGSILAGFFSTLTKNEPVTIVGNGENLTLTTKTSTVVLKTYNHDDFPTIPMVDDGESFSIPTKVLFDGIKSVSYSASFSDIKPEIASVYIYNEGEFLVFVATDSFRLAEKKIKVKGLPDHISILLPYKNIVEVLRVIPEENDTLTIHCTKNQIGITGDGFYITSRVIDGVFPDYRQIIPKDAVTTISVLKQELIQALKVSNVFSDKFNQISLQARPRDKFITLHAQNADIGETTAKVEATIEGESIEMHFNYRYFVECFQSITKESIELKAHGEGRAMIITGVNDASFLYLVMPMNR